jgi:1-acyl-sn-glycerol-3-phosphate acyltransferase
MRVAIHGTRGPLAEATSKQLQARGHQLTETEPECVIFFPGQPGESATAAALNTLAALVQRGGFRRLVLRSHACAFGSHSKNPGLLREDRISLLPDDVPEQHWLTAERIAARSPGWAAVRLAPVLHGEEDNLLTRRLRARVATVIAGRDPNVQFLSVSDAARALVAAAESRAAGIFNVGGAGAIPLRKALKAAGTLPIPIPEILLPLLGNRSIEVLQYNWTVATDRAAGELGFQPQLSTVAALAEFLRLKTHSHPERLRHSYDDWGLDLEYLRAWGWWFTFLRRIYWRIDVEGMENVPAQGRAMLISNHRGFMPLDAVMHLSLILTFRQRVTRFLILHGLLRFPFLSNFLTKVGGVIATRENAARLFQSENLVGLFPEGIRGTFTPYKQAYKLRDFAKSSWAEMAVENQAPIIPVAVVGHAEIFPIIGRIKWGYVTRQYGWPYLPIAPLFPLAPIPIPSKWHVRILEPAPLQGLTPQDARNCRLMQEFSHYIQQVMQTNIDDMVVRRKRVFWGRILDGTAPSRPRFDAGIQVREHVPKQAKM